MIQDSNNPGLKPLFFAMPQAQLPAELFRPVVPPFRLALGSNGGADGVRPRLHRRPHGVVPQAEELRPVQTKRRSAGAMSSEAGVLFS